MINLTNFNSCEWIALASSLAIYIGQNVTANEAGILSNFFSALGDNLGIISSEESENNNPSSNDIPSCHHD